jgi:hypothetical protein
MNMANATAICNLQGTLRNLCTKMSQPSVAHGQGQLIRRAATLCLDSFVADKCCLLSTCQRCSIQNRMCAKKQFAVAAGLDRILKGLCISCALETLQCTGDTVRVGAEGKLKVASLAHNIPRVHH